MYTLSMFLLLMSTSNCFNSLKYFLLSSGFSTNGALFHESSYLNSRKHSYFLHKFFRFFTCYTELVLFSCNINFNKNILYKGLSLLLHHLLQRQVFLNQLNESMQLVLQHIFTLFLCRCPIICHVISLGSVSALSTIS